MEKISGVFRSNYFRVRDWALFEEWAAKLQLLVRRDAAQKTAVAHVFEGRLSPRPEPLGLAHDATDEAIAQEFSAQLLAHVDPEGPALLLLGHATVFDGAGWPLKLYSWMEAPRAGIQCPPEDWACFGPEVMAMTLGHRFDEDFRNWEPPED